MTTHSEPHPEQPDQQSNYDKYVHYVVPSNLTGALNSYEVMLNYSMPKLPDIKMPPGIKWPAHIENHLKMIKTIKSPIHDYMTVETALSKQIQGNEPSFV